jgi:hypothetical protein
MKAPIEPTSHNEAKRRILVVTDEPGLSQALSLIFKGSGFGFCLAATGADGLRCHCAPCRVEHNHASHPAITHRCENPYAIAAGRGFGAICLRSLVSAGCLVEIGAVRKGNGSLTIRWIFGSQWLRVSQRPCIAV